MSIKTYSVTIPFRIQPYYSLSQVKAASKKEAIALTLESAKYEGFTASYPKSRVVVKESE